MDCIIGRRRQGKSTLALSLARAYDRTTIVFDPNDQFGAVPIIEDLVVWMGDSDERSIGRIVPSEKPDEAFSDIAAVLDGGRWNWSDYVLIVDEASMLMSPSWIHPNLERYARTAPKDVRIILTTHRPVDIHSLIRGLATDWYIFQQVLARDLKAIEDQFGADIAALTKGLPLYNVLHYWTEAGGTPAHVVWDKPADWYIDIGRTT